jgi:hypothetical protein
MSKAGDWFKDEYEFRQLCGDAQSQARGESSQNFAAEMVVKAKATGLATYLSYKQLEWLCKIADWDVPKPTHQEDYTCPKQLR